MDGNGRGRGRAGQQERRSNEALQECAGSRIRLQIPRIAT